MEKMFSSIPRKKVSSIQELKKNFPLGIIITLDLHLSLVNVSKTNFPNVNYLWYLTCIFINLIILN